MPETQRTLFDCYSGLKRAAHLSSDGRYRWWLQRSWQHGGDGRVVCFVMLNPSTADALIDDPTVRRCMGFAARWGFSRLLIRNLFALRATKPAELTTAHDPTGGHYGDAELATAASADVTVAAWGAHVPFGRDEEVLRILSGATLYCLGKTKNGCPRHPLYVRADQPLEVFVHADCRPDTWTGTKRDLAIDASQSSESNY